jgi:hypothetical protein
MRNIKLTGREACIVRAMGFTEAMLGADLQESTRMSAEDVTDTLNSLISAGFAESIPYYDEVQVAQMSTTSFEINPAYAFGLKEALVR